MANGPQAGGKPARSERAIVALALVGAVGTAIAGFVVLALLQTFLGFLWDLYGSIAVLLLLLAVGGSAAALLGHLIRPKPPAPPGGGATIEALDTRQL